MKDADGNNLNGNVTVHIGNYNYTVSVVDGTGSMVLRNVSAGTYAVSVDYAGTDKYTADSAVADDLVVSKITTQLELVNNTSLTLDVGDSASVNVTLKDADGNVIAYDGNITVRLGDYNYTVTLCRW